MSWSSRRSAERICVVLAALAFWTATPFAQQSLTGKVVGVTDGDTISVMRDGRAVRVRLEGIDCPENGQDFSQRAKRFTSDIAFGREAKIEVRDVDRYGRLVARVQVGGEDVSLALVQAGLAWHYLRYSRDPILAKAEMTARSAKLGLWSHLNPVPPWEFRRPTRFRPRTTVATCVDISQGATPPPSSSSTPPIEPSVRRRSACVRRLTSCAHPASRTWH